MVPQWVIERKRDGHALTEEEIRGFVRGFTDGTIPDYQMAALAMAIYLRGMTPEETGLLTDAMMRSGDLVDTSSLARPKVDKHSTGGIGDKISLPLAPLAACFGVAVPMISGRGLGITGGTLDKLESIPGYRTMLDEAEFLAVLRGCGCSIIGQTDRLVPADRKLYALRDVTATVPSIPLITASIMSKKLAEGIDALVLDVKFGAGAFMTDLARARELAESLVRVGRAMGKRVSALLTDMSQPLGRTAGNALEVAECLDILRGQGPEDATELTLALAEEMLRLCGKDVPRARLAEALGGGEARRRFEDMVRRHGGDPAAPRPQARLRREVPAASAGYVAAADAGAIGRACLLLGAGRARTTDRVDHAVGVSGIAKIGERVEKGQPLMVLHANDETRLEEAWTLARTAHRLSASPPERPALIREVLRSPPPGPA